MASSQITAAGYTAKAMGANVRIAEAMGETSKTMGQGGDTFCPARMLRMHPATSRRTSSNGGALCSV